MTDDTIYHIADAQELDKAVKSGTYKCNSLATEGFIHCCLHNQLAGVVERYYANVDGLQVLKLDAQRLNCAPVYENTLGGQELFPHIYGAINMDAVISVDALEPG